MRFGNSHGNARSVLFMKRNKNGIVRTVEEKKNKKKTSYSEKDLECLLKTKKTLECVDSEFGIFEI